LAGFAGELLRLGSRRKLEGKTKKQRKERLMKKNIKYTHAKGKKRGREAYIQIG
jgi:hypothetical protein